MSTSDPPLRVSAGVFAGFALFALVDAVAIALAMPLPSAGLGLRAAHHVFDAAETLGVGLLLALAAGAFVRFARVPPWVTSGVAVGTTVAVAWITNGEFLSRVASQLFNGRFEWAIFLAYLGLIGVGLWDALRGAVYASERPRLRFLPVAVAVVGLAADQVILSDDYVGVHCLVATGAALVGGAGLAPVAERALRALAARAAGRAALAAVGAFALFGIVWPPSDAVRLELFRQPCAVAPWVLSSTLWRAPSLHAPTTVAPSPWNSDRSKSPAVAPTEPPLLPPDAVVVLLTIDALRGDVVNDPANAALLPTLAALRHDGVVFTHASAPGTQTPVSLSALFSGLYFSEQGWAPHGVGSTRYLYPAEDPSVRFPELLSEHGVTTVSYGGLTFLRGEFGVLRGFREESVVVEGRQHAFARDLIDPLLARLQRVPHERSGPFFFYTHLMEPHAPYDRGRQDGTDFERYLSEASVADAAVGRVVKALAAGFGDRWVLLVGADHGEAFGEHGTTNHSKTLYEELLHVPLIARSPRFPARTIDDRVGLIDLGPTILDLLRVDTPATFNGQSLVPFLAGGTRTFTRPLLAEGRLRRAITEPDGFKVIDDPRRKLVEAYDLVADPHETRNVFDVEPARSDHALAELRAFFAVHTRTTGGYRTPYEQ